MRHDALRAHARDELGISDAFSARPVQAALASAAGFAIGAALPLVVTAVAPAQDLMGWVSSTSLVFLAVLGVVAAGQVVHRCWPARGG
jgi:VIT1/CCC1 family predicted Fe2+/Mn2+ transporter